MQQLQEDKTQTKNRRLNVVSLKMVREKVFPYNTNTIRCPEDAARLCMEFIGDEDREHLIVICLDTKNKISAIHTAHIGSLNSSIVHPREVLKLAVLSSSASIIISHNHPSSNVYPSREDLEVNERLKKACEIMGIDLLDHLIVSSDNYYSMKEKGHM